MIAPWYSYLIDTTLDKLPLRKSDGARVIDTARNVSRIYCKPSGITYLKRCLFFMLSCTLKTNVTTWILVRQEVHTLSIGNRHTFAFST